MGPHTGCMDELCVNVFFFSSLRGVLLVCDYFFRSVNVNLTCMGAHTVCTGAHTGFMHALCVTVFFSQFKGRLACT